MNTAQDRARSVLFLTQSGATLPSVRFRVLPFVAQGRDMGLDVDWRRIPKTVPQRLGFFFGLPRTDVIIVQKKLFSRFELGLLRRKCRSLVFDFDDALWTFHPSEPPGPDRDRRVARNAGRFARVCADVDLVIAGNDYLARRAAAHQGNVRVVPTPLDTDLYTPPDPAGPDREPCVGWMGTASNLYFLSEVFEALAPLSGEARFLVVADRRFSEKYRTRADFEFWTPDSELAQLRSMDIGLMPLTDDEYTRGKCGFKILQYMACGVVPVAADVGFNREIVEHGVDGLLVRDPSQWAEYVRLLARDRDLRAEMAAAARKKVVRDYSLKALSGRFWSAIGL
ncbi:MAG: glycosyltransferase family 4 protein [Desulfovibrionaceae bacterium]|nr:glycosyltransferase family 4 protein [Desulfovibrionaceae bacterium]MDD4951545.1 glycosyltransferase family 4 protein [Desulfovibrionaceae bacterium]